MKLRIAQYSLFFLIAATSLCVVTAVKAEPVVINSVGTTYPIAPFLKALPIMSLPTDSSDQNIPSITPPQSVSILPQQVSTPSMTAGTVVKRAVNLPQLNQPIFIVGSDSRSEDWLKQHHVRLGELGAIGFLVQAKNAGDIQRIQNLAPDCVILPLSGEAISQQLGIHHYPVLISKHLIEQ